MPSKKCSYNQWPRDELDPLVAAEDGRVFGEVVHEGHPALVGQLPDRVGALESFLHNLKLKQILIDLSSDERQALKPFLQFFFCQQMLLSSSNSIDSSETENLVSDTTFFYFYDLRLVKSILIQAMSMFAHRWRA